MPSPYSEKLIRSRFPLISEGNFSYLDSAATSQKPDSVINAVQAYYEHTNANVHRGVYKLGERSTQAYNGARQKVADFLGGCKFEEIVFTRGTTESINLIATTWCAANLQPGDEILITIAEHHSNIVPWQMAAERYGAKVRFIPLNDKYRIDLEEAQRWFNEKTKVFACGHVSNVLGVVHPVKDLIAMAKSVGALTVLDGAQAIPHFDVDVLDLDCDFYCFSGHKTFAPTGIGVLYGKKHILEALPPYQGGGDMIQQVTKDGFVCAPLPAKFEAGTPNIAGAIGLAAAIDFMDSYDREAALAHDIQLGRRFAEAFRDNKNIRMYYDGGDDWVGVVTFYHEIVHPHDMAAIADSGAVCIRAGHHCAQPLMDFLGVPATSRVSPSIYSTQVDIEQAISAVKKAEEILVS